LTLTNVLAESEDGDFTNLAEDFGGADGEGAK